MIRVLVCAPHPVFAESLAHLLERRGNDVVAVVDHVDAALTVLHEHPVDICLIDVGGDTQAGIAAVTRLRDELPDIRCLLLVEDAEASAVAVAAAGLGVAAEKRRTFSELVELLERVHSEGVACDIIGTGGPDPASVGRFRSAEARSGDGRRWLASFLTPREREVLSALVCGEDTVKVARSMGISPATARCHIQSVLTKLGAHSRLEAVTIAVREGMVSPQTGEWLIERAS
jgi:two-component system, NarL family, nitrate/nitrite response regulator NarL